MAAVMLAVMLALPAARAQCPPCECPPPPAEPPATVADDPHIRNLRQESFAVNRPGDYLFLRLPLDRNQPALLEVRGSIGELAGSPCKMYTTGVSISGAWLGHKEVHVRPLKRSLSGSNDAGHQVSPLSLMVTDARMQLVSGNNTWTSFESLSAPGKPRDNFGLPDTFKVAAFHDSSFGKLREGETFQFLVGASADPLRRAKINVAQASHQALNVALVQAKSLGSRQLGGLLGTEPHDEDVEALTNQCKQWKSSASHLVGGMNLISFHSHQVRPSTVYAWWS